MPSATLSRRLEWLTHQREATLGEITEIGDRAVDQSRDLNDDEQAAIEQRRAAIERYDAEIETEAALARSTSAYDALAAELGPALNRRRPTGDDAGRGDERQGDAVAELYRGSPGQYLADFLLRGEDEVRRARFDAYHRAAAPHVTTAETPGVLPVPVLGPVWTSISTRRPAIEAATTRPLPAGGKTFVRPHVTQHTAVDTQSAEKTALVSQQLKIDPLNVSKITKGGWVNLSHQDRDWSDPAILDILVSDLAAAYAQETDDQFCDDFLAAVTQTETVASGDAEGWLTAIYAAAATVYSAANSLPTTMWLSTDVWGSLGALVDGAGRPLFPSMVPSNGMGDITPGTFAGSVAGMVLAVDANFPAQTAIIGDRRAAEFYETVGGQVRAEEPSLLGTNIAFYGYMATCIVEPDAFVKLVPPAAPLSGGTQSGSSSSKK